MYPPPHLAHMYPPPHMTQVIDKAIEISVRQDASAPFPNTHKVLGKAG